MMSNNYEVNTTTENKRSVCTQLVQTTPDFCDSRLWLCLWFKCALNPVVKQTQKYINEKTHRQNIGVKVPDFLC